MSSSAMVRSPSRVLSLSVRQVADTDGTPCHRCRLLADRCREVDPFRRALAFLNGFACPPSERGRGAAPAGTQRIGEFCGLSDAR